MSLIEEISKHSSGAHFHRADLHVHTFGKKGSYDVADERNTAQNIIDLAISEGIGFLSITDHNEIGNVEGAIEYAMGKPILVVPGVELSTPNGHLLIYAPTIEALNTVYGRLGIETEPGTGAKKVCNNTIIQCLDFASAVGGFGIAAHIDLDSGFEHYTHGYTPHKAIILNHKALLGLEIAGISAANWFTDVDPVQDRTRLLVGRRAALGLDPTAEIAKVMNSDAHSLTALGRNAAGNKRITRIKADELNFEALKIALLDSGARVRIEEQIPQDIPRFVGIKFDGGFLDGQAVNLSKNLTCIIGGRGTGKSTILESTRVSSGNKAGGMVDNEVWPERISLIYEDETGRQTIFVKDRGKSLINASDPSGVVQVRIESFGQGETAETLHHSDKDPGVMIEFFDEFVDFGDLKERDEEYRQKLLENQTLVERLRLDVNAIPEVERAKNTAEAQLTALKDKNAAGVVELEEALVNEKALRAELVEQLRGLISGIKQSFSDKTLFEHISQFEAEKIVVGQNEFKEIQKLTDALSKKIDEHAAAISDDSAALIKEISAKLASWKSKERETQDKIQSIRESIVAKGGRLDLAFIQKVTGDVSAYRSKLATLTAKKTKLSVVEKERAELLSHRLEIKAEMYRRRYEFITRVNSRMKANLIDLSISIRIHEGRYSPELCEAIKNAMSWRTSQVRRADFIVNNLSYNELLAALRKNNSSLLRSLNGSDGKPFFSSGEVSQIFNTLRNQQVLFDLDRCHFDDLITITLTRTHRAADGSVQAVQKDFSQLSLGQQQSTLLSIILSSNRNCPLIIDQPEDNLDSEFIFQTVVNNLRTIKEHRQVIIVTHNANIAVLGDAELIIPLKSTSEKTHILDRGSIDNPRTKVLACAILEGGEKAFIRRHQIYGI